MHTWKKCISWLAISLPALCGILLYFIAPSSRFLALVLLGCAALAAVFVLLHLLRKRHRKVGSSLLVLLSIFVSAGLIVAIWVGCLIGSAIPGHPDKSCDYLVLLGAGINGTTPSQSLQMRIDAAAVYLQEHPQVQCILSGGQGDGEDISEAECMFRALTAMGIDPQRLWLEDRSTSTKENISYSLELLRQKTGSIPQELGVLSNEYHLYRASFFVREQGLEPVCISVKTDRFGLFISYFVREIFAVCFYSVFG
jgi:uncharacterized SAM-binding protein YcdF (DUF218 family)